jgi:hypothetical protein
MAGGVLLVDELDGEDGLLFLERTRSFDADMERNRSASNNNHCTEE